MKIYPTIAEALTLGGSKLAVDGVLLIGEHGKYPRNERRQTLYPRYEFFQEIVKVFRSSGRSVPVFSDKHLSWKWEWAKEMYDTARSMGFAFMAGSSLPVTWRTPSIEMPAGSVIREAMCVCYGGVDSYDIHALEAIQCMVERRKGGEAGVKWLEALSRRPLLDGAQGRRLAARTDGGRALPQLHADTVPARIQPQLAFPGRHAPPGQEPGRLPTTNTPMACSARCCC